MKYPVKLQTQIDEIKQIIKEWPIAISMNEVFQWIMQFDNDDFDLAFRIIKHMNVIGVDDLDHALSIAYSKLQRKAKDKNTEIKTTNTLFVGIGDEGKSGAMVSYHFRVIHELSEENFINDTSLKHLEEGGIENIVLVDDIISTGNQAITEINKLTEKVTALGVKNIFLLTAVGMKDAIEKIEKETKAYTFSAFEYNEKDTVQNLDADFYNGIPFERREYILDRLKYYGQIANRNALGHGGIGGLIVFYYRTPNSTLPIVWGTGNSWIPLFKSAIRINGINLYYKQINKSIANKKTKAKKSDLTFYVERKIDEMFFDRLHLRLQEKLSISKLNIVALNGFHVEKLIDSIETLTTNYLFIAVEDATESAKIKKSWEKKPHLFIKPIVDYFDFEKAYSDKDFQTILPSLPEGFIFGDDANKRDLGQRIFTHPQRELIIHTIINKFLIRENFTSLIELIGDAIEKYKLKN
ncbi:MAG: hypothetical protein AAF518_23640 [Spirochaetota bacterium]